MNRRLLSGQKEAGSRNPVYLKFNMANEITRNVETSTSVATKDYAERKGRQKRIINFTKNLDMDAIMSVQSSQDSTFLAQLMLSNENRE